MFFGASYMLFLVISLTLQASSDATSCLSGWSLNENSCYRHFSTKKTWDDAEADCVTTGGGHLVSITSNIENSFVYNLSGNTGGYNVWIGLNDKIVENSFVWSDGTTCLYRQWSGNQASNVSSENCTILRRANGRWNDKECITKYYYVCETPTLTTHPPPLTSASSMQCQSGWTRRGLSCYLLVTMPKTWDAAEEDCNNKGGHLASITFAKENCLVLSLRGISRLVSNDAWIGLNDKDVENTFVWINGEQSTFTNWDNSVNEPNGNGDCIRMVYDGTWRDIACTRQFPYICKYNLMLSTTQTPTTVQATTIPYTSASATTKTSSTNSSTASALSITLPTTVAATVDRSPIAHETKSSSSNDTTYVAVGAAIGVIVVIASIIFVFIVRRRKARKLDFNKTVRSHAAGSKCGSANEPELTGTATISSRRHEKSNNLCDGSTFYI
ncbi:macrophage mannose receptor 1-like [Corticium candelabrum]|uniref:macrophage mannose receptor 1-like n=1 Tax=Corticium candelabrum TaxID=121492 RepID=UPI002E271B6E|nr:macrophage mannose receptor 1-like [Corticium candelabrum]